MAQTIPTEAVVMEKTYVGKVRFPVSIPENLIDYMQFPDDLIKHAPTLGLSERAVKFILAALRGKWGLRPTIDLQDLAIKTAMQYAEMDAIVRDLIDKNYARLDERLELYRLWVCLLHVMDIEFSTDAE